jgi:hypothetical protein
VAFAILFVWLIRRSRERRGGTPTAREGRRFGI